MRATAGSIVVDLLMKTGMFETDADKAERRLRKLAKEIENLNKQTEKSNQSTNRTQNNQTNTVGGAGGGMLAGLGLGNLGRGAGIAGTIATYARLSDEATKLRGILMSSTSENIKYSQSLNDVTRIASVSQTGLEGVGIAYGRIALATADLGLKQREVADIVETVSLALKVNGATAAETQSVLIQLSQAFGKGKLDGDEFRTVMEAAPPVMRKLAESLGVPFGALKDMAAQGRLTSEVLTKAWGDPAYLSQLRRQAESMQTVSGSITVARNSLVNLVATFDTLIPVSKLASGAITGVANVAQFLADTINRKPLDWNKFFNSSGLPIGMSVKLDPKTGEVIAGTIAEVNKKIQESLEKNKPKDMNLILGKNDTIQDIANKMKAQSDALKGFIGDKTYQTAAEKLQADVDALYKSFTDSVKDVPEGAPNYMEALDVFKARYNELVNGTPKKPREKTGKSEFEKEQDKIKNFIASLDKQVALLGKENTDILKYDASLLKLSETQKKSVAQNIKLIESFSQQDEILNTADKINQDYIPAIDEFIKEVSELDKLFNREKSLKLDFDLGNRKNGTKKGLGFLGPLVDSSGNFVTEFTVGVNIEGKEIEIPTLVPTLNKEEINKILTLKESDVIPTEIIDKAVAFAKTRLEKGLDVFASPTESKSLINLDAYNLKFDELIENYTSATGQANDYKSVLETLNDAVANSFNPQNKDRILEFASAYNDLKEQLKSKIITIEEFTKKTQELFKATNEQAKVVERLNEIIRGGDIQQLEEQRKLVAEIYREYETGTNEALDSIEELTDVVNEALGRQRKEVKDTSDFMEAAYKRAAENIQDSLSNFLYEPFKEGMDGMLVDFLNVLRRMASEALSVEILKKIFDVSESKDINEAIVNSFKSLLKNLEDLFGDFSFSDLFKNMFSSTGLTGASAGNPFNFNLSSLFGSNSVEPLSDFVPAFQLGDAVAPDSGGFFSSISDFFGGFFEEGGRPPLGKMSVVGEKGPELFIPDSAGTIVPNSVLNQTNQTPANVSTKIINVLDPSLLSQYLRTDEGEKLVMNTIQRNRSALGF
jgi:tape measure domain-containing protein